MLPHRLLVVAVWLVAVAKGSQDPEGGISRHQVYQQDNQGGYQYQYSADAHNAEAVADPANEVRGRYSFTDATGQSHGVEYTAGVRGYMPRILGGKLPSVTTTREPVEYAQPNADGAYQFNIDTGIIRHQQTRDPEGSVRGQFGYSTDGRVFQAKYNIGQDKTSQATIGNSETPASVEYQNDHSDSSTTKDLITDEGYPEEGSEEIDSEGNIQGRYTYIDQDGVPATVEYIAGPEIGFVVKTFIRHQIPHDHLQTQVDTARQNDPLSTLKQNNQEESDDTIELNGTQADDSTEIPPSDPVQAPPTYEYSTVLAKYKPETKKVMGVLQNDETYLPPVTLRNPEAPLHNPGYLEKGNQKPALDVESVGKLETVSPTVMSEEDEEEEPPSVDASYKFGFSADGQTRNEESDAKGNVQGSYSYIGSDGLLTEVEYEAGAEKGFVVKKLTTKQADPLIKSGQSVNTKSQSNIDFPEELNHKDGDSTVAAVHQIVQEALNDEDDTQPKAGTGEISTSKSDTKTEDVRGSNSFPYDIPNQSREESDNAEGSVKGRLSYVTPDDSNKRKVYYESSTSHGFVTKGSHLQSSQNPHELTNSESNPAMDNTPQKDVDESYSFSFETPDQSRQESSDAGGNVNGQFSFVTKNDGIRRNVSYKADKVNGYSAVGSHLPSSQDATLTGTPEIQDDGSYSYSYTTSDQTKQETGDTTGNVQGEFSYVHDDGVRRTVSYKAGQETGFVAEGSHLPSLHRTENEGKLESEESVSLENAKIKENSRIATAPKETDLESEQQQPSIPASYSLYYNTADRTKVDPGNANAQDGFQYTVNNYNKQRTVLSEVPSDSWFNPFGIPTPNQDPSPPEVILDTTGIRRAVAVSDINKMPNKKQQDIARKRPAIIKNFPKIMQDGSYSFSYETNDQSREESVDAEGNVHSSYRFKTKGDGQTVVVLIRKTVKNSAQKEKKEEASDQNISDRNSQDLNPPKESARYRDSPIKTTSPVFNRRRNIQGTPEAQNKHSGVRRRIIRKYVQKTDSRSQRPSVTPSAEEVQDSRKTNSLKMDFKDPFAVKPEIESKTDFHQVKNENTNVETIQPPNDSRWSSIKPFRGLVKFNSQ